MNQKELLIISVTLFMTVVTWIFADLYHVSSSQQVKPADPQYLKPITVQIHPEILDTLEKKK